MHAWVTLGVAELPRNSGRLGLCFDWCATSADQVIADLTQPVVSLAICPILRRSFPDQTLCGCCYVTNALLTITILFYKTTWFRDGVPWLGSFNCTTTKTKCMYINFCFQFLGSADNYKTPIFERDTWKWRQLSWLLYKCTLNHCEYCSTKKIIWWQQCLQATSTNVSYHRDPIGTEVLPGNTNTLGKAF